MSEKKAVTCGCATTKGDILTTKGCSGCGGTGSRTYYTEAQLRQKGVAIFKPRSGGKKGKS